MNSIQYSNLEFKHLDGLKSLYENAFEMNDSNLDQMKVIFETIKNNDNYHILCAIDNNKIVGSVTGVICHELYGNCSPFMVVENVAVLKDYRRRGIAKKLMEKLENKAREMNCGLILFVSSEHRKGAHKLYESLGFGVDKVKGYRKRLK